MSIRSYCIVHSDEKRHKCHYCGAVRYEYFMVKLKGYETRACAQFNNDSKCWACRHCYKQEKEKHKAYWEWQSSK